MEAPGLDDARRAARVVLDAGARRVLLYGSVARGDARPGSDIDLVAIFDDLGDYSDRLKRRIALERAAIEAAGCPVDVMVTDGPEWAVRTAKVACSIETRIAGYAITLAESGPHPDIDWDKPIGRPATPAGELQEHFETMHDAIAMLDSWLRPTDAEAAAAADGDDYVLAARETVRHAAAMAEVYLPVATASRIIHIATVGTTPPHSHRIPDLLAELSQPARDAFSAQANSGAGLEELHDRRDRTARPKASFDENALRNHAATVLGVAELAADHCRNNGIDERLLSFYDQTAGHTTKTLNGTLRHRYGR